MRRLLVHSKAAYVSCQYYSGDRLEVLHSVDLSLLTTFAMTMRLLSTFVRKTEEFLPRDIPPYVILSHRWKDEEVSYKDLTEWGKESSTLQGWRKLESFRSLAREDGWEWVWMDTCCIDKSSSAEVSEAINSMYQWYLGAEFCIAYLADVSLDKDKTGMRRKQFDKSEWFKRGWTLQELLASREVVFYDESWENIGTRTKLQDYVSRATHISSHHLSRPGEASAAAKMSWASNRKTAKPEDIAYCLLGLFDVNMPLLYGEGERKAFQRLQYEIVRSRRDETIFAWTREEQDKLEYANMPPPGLLAPSPRNFSKSGDLVAFDLERAKVHAPQILFDGLVWTIERSRRECDDRSLLAPDEVPYVVPLACSTFGGDKPTKLELVIPQTDKPPRRGPSTSLDFFSESEMRSIRRSKARTYHLIQEQPRAHGPFFRNIFRRSFTLRLSASAQHQCSIPRKCGQGVELHNSAEPGWYIVSASEENQDRVGITMQYRKRTMIEVACDPVSFCKWHLIMKINTQIFRIEFGGFNYSSEHNSINLGDRAIVSLGQGQNISVSPKHGLREGQNEVVVYIDCNAEKPIDLRGIFSDNSAEGTIDNAYDYDTCASPHS